MRDRNAILAEHKKIINMTEKITIIGTLQNLLELGLSNKEKKFEAGTSKKKFDVLTAKKSKNEDPNGDKLTEYMQDLWRVLGVDKMKKHNGDKLTHAKFQDLLQACKKLDATLENTPNARKVTLKEYFIEWLAVFIQHEYKESFDEIIKTLTPKSEVIA
jgi:hypothetical protein